MIVSICPLFECHCNCNYCYLGKLRSSTNILDLDNLEHMLFNIRKHASIDAIDVFGGDMSLLDSTYVEQLSRICNRNSTTISLTLNFNQKSKMFCQYFENISFSFNYERKDCASIKDIDFSHSINIVALPSIVEIARKHLIEEYVLDRLSSTCNRICIFQYQPSIYQCGNKIEVGDDDYEFVLEEFYKYKDRIQILNFQHILQENPSMSESIFILPDSTYGWIEYTLENDEYFQKSTSIEDYYTAVEEEKRKYMQKCATCQHFNRCYTEHLNLNKDCSGHRNLLDWYILNK